MSADLIARARQVLDDDERTALAACSRGRGAWRLRQLGRPELAAIVGEPAPGLPDVTPQLRIPLGRLVAQFDGDDATVSARHAVRHDPATVLARVARMRVLVDAYAAAVAAYEAAEACDDDCPCHEDDDGEQHDEIGAAAAWAVVEALRPIVEGIAGEVL